MYPVRGCGNLCSEAGQEISSGEEAQRCPTMPPSVLGCATTSALLPASVTACLFMAPPPLPQPFLGILPTMWEPLGLAVPCSFPEIPFSESTLTFAPGPAPRPHSFILGCFYSLTKRIWSQDVLGPWLPLELAQASSCGGGCVGWERSGEETGKEPSHQQAPWSVEEWGWDPCSPSGKPESRQPSLLLGYWCSNNGLQTHRQPQGLP